VFNSTAEYESLTLRAGFGRLKVTNDSLTVAAYKAGLASLAGTYPAEVASLQASTSFDNQYMNVYGIGFNYDPGHWFVLGEIAGRRGHTDMIQSAYGGYLQAGYRHGKWTPYAGYSQVRSTEDFDSTVMPSGTAAAAVINAVNADFRLKLEQRTVTVGMRYDVWKNIALKAQLLTTSTNLLGPAELSSAIRRDLPVARAMWRFPASPWISFSDQGDQNMKQVKLGFLLAAVLAAFSVRAEMVVFVSAQSSVDKLETDVVQKIFLGKLAALPGGASAVPVDLPDGADRDAFYQKVSGKSAAQVKAYWAKLVFTGKGQPPKEATSAKDAVAQVGKSAGGIGYAERKALDKSVKVVLTLP